MHDNTLLEWAFPLQNLSKGQGCVYFFYNDLRISIYIGRGKIQTPIKMGDHSFHRALKKHPSDSACHERVMEQRTYSMFPLCLLDMSI